VVVAVMKFNLMVFAAIRSPWWTVKVFRMAFQPLVSP
jgi:hypothetical protein